MLGGGRDLSDREQVDLFLPNLGWLVCGARLATVLAEQLDLEPGAFWLDRFAVRWGCLSGDR